MRKRKKGNQRDPLRYTSKNYENKIIDKGDNNGSISLGIKRGRGDWRFGEEKVFHIREEVAQARGGNRALTKNNMV